MKMKNTVVLMIVVVAVATIVAVFSAVSCSEHTDKEHVRDMVLAENPGLKGILELYQEDSLKYYSKHFHLLQPLFPLTSKSAVLRTVQFSICSQPLSRSCSPYERKTAQFAP